MRRVSVLRARGRIVAIVAFAAAALVFGSFAGSSGAVSAPFVAIDLGTLGGRTSGAVAVNNSGQVVGTSDMIRSAYLPDHAFSWTQAGGMVDLGSLGGSRSEATAVNDSGQVVGDSTTASGYVHAFMWTQPGGMVDLGTLGDASGFTDSYATAVNGGGQVVGYSSGPNQGPRAFSWTQAGGMVSLGDGPWMSEAVAVNNSGQVVGYVFNNLYTTAFSWTQAGGMVDLGTLGVSGFGRAVSEPSAVNDSGQVVGSSTTASGATHAFLWTQAGGMIDLGTLRDGNSYARALNEGGQVVGWTESAAGSHAFSWTPGGGMVELESSMVDRGTFSVADEVNNSGQVVGEIYDASGGEHTFSWTQAGGIIELSSGACCHALLAAVNERGHVVGTSDATGYRHATLWQPSDAMPPTLTVPADLALDATSPNGALVAFSASAADDVDDVVPVTCMPASGTLFPIGNTTVSCTAHDSSGNTVSASFSVHVRGAAERLRTLAAAVNGLAPGTSLGDKLAQAATGLNAGDNATVASTLKAFINEVKAQRGKKIAPDTAAALTSSANQIIAVLG
jgi:probable HAF family extracellular repeat protein